MLCRFAVGGEILFTPDARSSGDCHRGRLVNFNLAGKQGGRHSSLVSVDATVGGVKEAKVSESEKKKRTAEGRKL